VPESWPGQRLIARAGSRAAPVAAPANMMVTVPADYWRSGLCLLALFFVVATFLVPVLMSL
jgi:hypothetical protein